MKVLLVGCGSVGGITAATLLRAGRDVAIVTGNPEISRAIDSRGIVVRDLDGSEWTARLARPSVVRARELLSSAPFDLCLLATKTTTLETALSEALPLLHPDAPVLCMQNGLPEERAAAILGPDRIIGCVVGWGATLIEPGRVARSSSGGFQLGRLFPSTSAPDAMMQAAAAELGHGFSTKIVSDLSGVRWSKLAINCATSTIGAAGGDTLGRLLRRRFVRRLALEIWAELSAVARAHSVRLSKVMGTLDIEKLSITDRERRLRVGSPALFMKHSLLWAIGLKFRRMRSSMAIALERGRKPEIDFLNGEVVRRGAAKGIPTPVNSALVELIHDVAAGRQKAGVDTLYAMYERVVAPLGSDEASSPRTARPPSKPESDLGSGAGRRQGKVGKSL